MRDSASNLLLPMVLSVIILGALQSLLIVVFPETGLVKYLDDVMIVLTVLVLLVGRGHKLPRLAWIMTGLWTALVIIASLRSIVGVALTIELARQILIPVALILVGLVLAWDEWRKVAKAGLIVGVLNGAYATIEMIFGRLIHPGAIANPSDRKPDGIPASYFYWDADGVEHIRAGGLALNPPIAGILIGGAIVLGFFLATKWWQHLLVFSLVVPLYLTNSRAGMLIAIAGVIVPLALKYTGALCGTALALAGAVAGYFYFGAQGKSFLHLEGLTTPLISLISNPLGQGIGTYGNFAKRNQIAVESSESLIGVAIGTTGVVGLLLVGALLVMLLWRLFRGTTAPSLAGLALGVLGAALVSESVSALSATVPFWAVAGVVLMSPDPSKGLTLLPRLKTRPVRGITALP